MQSTNKECGHLAEIRFILEATKQGFTISQPFGAYHKYDYILEHKGRLLRIQVKSSIMPKLSSGSYHVTIHAHKKYKQNSVDFIVIYIREERSFFILPIAILESRLTISINRNNNLWGYKNRWDLLK